MSTLFERPRIDDDGPDAARAPALGDVLLLDADVENDLPVFAGLLQPAGYRVRAAASLGQAGRLIEKAEPIAGLLRLDSDRPPPVEAIEALLERQPSLRLIALVEPGEAARQLVAPLVQRHLIHDFHTLPPDPGRLLVSLGHIRGLVALERVAEATRRPAEAATLMVGESPAMRRVADAVRKVARSPAPVLIRGESGTGKELVARAIHQHAPRAEGPFVAVNCAGLPPGLVGSELFGHEKGAFTGAIARKVGRIEAAAGGTLFLDEIGDLPLELQGHLLRFLQEQTIERIGGSGPIRVDVRVLAATHVDLERAVAEGRFREDLFYRLNVLTVDLPPLRERGDDIERIARHFLARYARELGRPLHGFRESARAALRRHSWPGNVRELISAVHRAAVMAEGKWVSAEDLGLTGTASSEARQPTLQEARAELDKRLVAEALAESGQTVQAAARRLGVSRMTLYRLLERYDLAPARERADET